MPSDEPRVAQLPRVRTKRLALAALVCVSCGRHADRTGPDSAGPSGALVPTALAAMEAAPANAAPARPPLQSSPPIVPLPIPGSPEAVVSIPIGATSPRPVVVATHGLWDFPEGLCDNWRWIVGDRAWVLCPRGDAMPDGTFRYRSGPALAREVEAGLAELGRRFPGYLDEGPVLYTGFSLGAILGVWVISHEPERYPRAVLIEGGEDKVTAAVAAGYARGGGQRVLFACGLKARVPPATQAAQRLERAGVGSRVILGKLPDAGQFMHWYNGPVADETKAQLDWLLEGDTRW